MSCSTTRGVIAVQSCPATLCLVHMKTFLIYQTHSGPPRAVQVSLSGDGTVQGVHRSASVSTGYLKLAMPTIASEAQWEWGQDRTALRQSPLSPPAPDVLLIILPQPILEFLL